MKGHGILVRAALALGFAAVGCAGSKSEVKPSQAVARTPPSDVGETQAKTGATETELRPSLEPIHFDFDKSLIHTEDATTLERIGRYLLGNPDRTIVVSGHCDDRGTVEYNVALGDRRAVVAREFLVKLGIDPVRIHTISYGEAKPVDAGQDESAWARNRRDEFQLELKQRAQANP